MNLPPAPTQRFGRGVRTTRMNVTMSRIMPDFLSWFAIGFFVSIATAALDLVETDGFRFSA
jgi:hypothetical protein